MLYRLDGITYALADHCSHAGGPLHEGEVDGELCVTCPWHLSRFSLTDGRVEAGPASVPVPVFDVRERDGGYEVRLRPSA
jgi:nitrite reductase/ring-hydroxylating ferredoxin subunit